MPRLFAEQQRRIEVVLVIICGLNVAAVGDHLQVKFLLRSHPK